MRENYRNSIASIKKFPQFTTMHVIDGQAGLIICASLIFYSLTIDNILNIIVLLILAGISIMMLSGNNGILNRATQAKEATRGSEVQEKVRLEATNNTTSDYIGGEKKSRAKVIEELHDMGKLTDDEVDMLTDEENPVDVITIGGITIDFSVLGTSSNSNTLVAMFRNGEGCTVENCTDPTHLHIGDYVNYTNPTSGSYHVESGTLGVDEVQTYVVSSTQNQLNWRVLGIEGTGKDAYIKLIAGSPMKKSTDNGSAANESDPYLKMRGAKAYTNAITELNNICALCKNETLATKAESVTMNDIDKLTGVTTDALKQQYNLDQFYGGKNYGDTYEFNNQWTPTTWIENGNTEKVANGQEPTGAGKISNTVNGYYYSINPQDGSNPYVTMSNTRIYNMLFDNVEFGKGKTYWLSSVGVGAYSAYAYFGPATVGEFGGVVYAGTSTLFRSGGNEDDGSFAVRPVVSLMSGVTNEQCSKITDKTETTWNYGE